MPAADKLPVELRSRIVGYLNRDADLVSLAGTCQAFYNIIAARQEDWRQRYKRAFEPHQEDATWQEYRDTLDQADTRPRWKDGVVVCEGHEPNWFRRYCAQAELRYQWRSSQPLAVRVHTLPVQFVAANTTEEDATSVPMYEFPAAVKVNPQLIASSPWGCLLYASLSKHLLYVHYGANGNKTATSTAADATLLGADDCVALTMPSDLVGGTIREGVVNAQYIAVIAVPPVSGASYLLVWQLPAEQETLPLFHIIAGNTALCDLALRGSWLTAVRSSCTLTREPSYFSGRYFVFQLNASTQSLLGAQEPRSLRGTKARFAYHVHWTAEEVCNCTVSTTRAPHSLETNGELACTTEVMDQFTHGAFIYKAKPHNGEMRWSLSWANHNAVRHTVARGSCPAPMLTLDGNAHKAVDFAYTLRSQPIDAHRVLLYWSQLAGPETSKSWIAMHVLPEPIDCAYAVRVLHELTSASHEDRQRPEQSESVLTWAHTLSSRPRLLQPLLDRDLLLVERLPARWSLFRLQDGSEVHRIDYSPSMRAVAVGVHGVVVCADDCANIELRDIYTGTLLRFLPNREAFVYGGVRHVYSERTGPLHLALDEVDAGYRKANHVAVCCTQMSWLRVVPVADQSPPNQRILLTTMFFE